MRQFATDLFRSGNNGEVLKKKSDKNMDFGWDTDSSDLPTIEEMPYALYPRYDYLRNSGTRANDMVHIARAPFADYNMGIALDVDLEDGTIEITLTNNSEEAVEFYDFFDLYIRGNVTDVAYTGEDLTASLLPWKGYVEIQGVGTSVAAGESITTTLTFTGTLIGVDEENYYAVVKMLLVPKPTRQQSGFVLTADNRGGFAWVDPSNP